MTDRMTGLRTLVDRNRPLGTVRRHQAGCGPARWSGDPFHRSVTSLEMQFNFKALRSSKCPTSPSYGNSERRKVPSLRSNRRSRPARHRLRSTGRRDPPATGTSAPPRSRAEGGIVEDVEMVGDRATGRIRWQPHRAFDAFLTVRIGLDQAGFDGEGLPTDEPGIDASPQHDLEQPAQQIAVAEAPLTVLGEGRMVGHPPFEAEAAEPTIGRVQVDLVAQPALGANAESLSDDQHPDHRFGIDRRTPGRAVEPREVRPQFGEVDEAIDRPAQVIGRHGGLDRPSSTSRLPPGDGRSGG